MLDVKTLKSPWAPICSQPASKSSWGSQDFGDVNMVLKLVHFHKSSRPQWVNKNMAGIWMVVFSLRFLNLQSQSNYDD